MDFYNDPKRATVEELANRIFNFLALWEQDGISPESIAAEIETRPGDVIELLLDLLEA